MTVTFQAVVLNPGECRAPVLVLDEPLSFWGGFDPVNGTVVDNHHPQRGESVAGKVLVMPSSRGSAGTPAGIAEAIRREVGPVAVVLGTVDVNIAIGAMVADRLYGGATPVLTVAAEDYGRLRTGDEVAIGLDGVVTGHLQNMLLDRLDSARVQLENAGFVCRVRERTLSTACAVDLDCARFVGTVCHWAPETFEFQFNSAATGEVIVLETKQFHDTQSLGAYVAELLLSLDESIPKWPD